jgi:hypothetical protein
MKKLLIFVILLTFNTLAFGQKQVTHMVMFKLKPGITREDSLYKRAYAILQDLPKKIKEIEDWSIGENFSTRPIAYDVGLIVILGSRKDLNQYLTHPAHTEAVNAWKEIADWHIADFEEGL